MKYRKCKFSFGIQLNDDNYYRWHVLRVQNNRHQIDVNEY